jgi:uncharacterized protein YfbU (UPF0304 family)
MFGKKESSMTVQNFGMFSEEGNKQIADIIEFHKNNKSSWAVAQQNLRDLADCDYELFGEAMDTVVREAVYEAIGAYARGEDFFC